MLGAVNRADRLLTAIEDGKLSMVRALLDETPELLEARGAAPARRKDKTPLMVALQCGARATARELIARGADVRARLPDGGASVIALAARFAGPSEAAHDATLPLISELIDRGADPTDALWPALHAYQRARPWRARLVLLLVARGANRDHVLPSGSVRALVEINRRLYPPEILALFDP